MSIDFQFCLKSSLMILLWGMSYTTFAQTEYSSDFQMFPLYEEGHPQIIIYSPELVSLNQTTGCAKTEATEVSITGRILHMEGVAFSAEINGEELKIADNGEFEINLSLEVGENPLEITALDSQERRSILSACIERFLTEKRLALVIGNSAYDHAAPLKNPVNDAEAIGKVLEDLNFEVLLHKDLNYLEMNRVIGQFNRAIQDADITLVYFSGHGLQVGNHNYLVPVDAVFETEFQVKTKTVDAELILEALAYKEKEGLDIIILDACRNNPLVTWRKGNDGLTQLLPPSGALIAFATAPGAIAQDGKGKYGLYTQELIKQLQKPQRIEDVFINTRKKVEDQSNGSQRPWELMQLRGEYFLKRP